MKGQLLGSWIAIGTTIGATIGVMTEELASGWVSVLISERL